MKDKLQVENDNVKLKICVCPECGFESRVEWRHRSRKICPECLASKSIIVIMTLVPNDNVVRKGYYDESDYEDAKLLGDDDGYKQESLS